MPDAIAWTAREAAASLRRPTAGDDKYSRGVVGLRTGSEQYPGAAVLGVEASWRAGTGMVRYLGRARPSDLVMQRRPETVTVDGRVQAWVIGSGTDAASRDEDETAALRSILAGDLPVVVDAGALDLVPGAAAPLVVTPHAREHDALRRTLGLDGRTPLDPAGRRASVVETASALGGVVLLKGDETLVADPAGRVLSVRAGTPWLATAGTGDVLGGVVGAIVAGVVARAQAADAATAGPAALAQAAATAAWLHGRAGQLASEASGGGPITALDVAEALPRAVAELLAETPPDQAGPEDRAPRS